MRSHLLCAPTIFVTGSAVSGPIVFVGPMASGKSSIGRQVAELLNLPFVDTDAEIVSQHGPIPEIFAVQGEAAFRALEEHVVLSALNQGEACIVSLGGGAVLSERTRDELKKHVVILLMTDQETVVSRANLEKRPLLRDDPNAWTRILAERLPFYEAVATVTFDVARLPKEMSAANIVAWLKEEGVV